jgi:hypothetical protein
MSLRRSSPGLSKARKVPEMPALRHMQGFVAALLLCFVGCSQGDAPTLADTQGIVTYKGRPLDAANVSFVPESGPIAVGVTDAEGRFTLTTFGEKGAPIGVCRIAIQAHGAFPPGFKPPVDPSGETGYVEPPWRIPRSYGTIQTSGLTATIEANKLNEVSLEVK